MAITISGENNNDKILASDGVIDQLSGFSITGIITATTFTGDLTGNVTGNLTGNVNSTSPLLLQTGGYERFRITGNNELGIAGANYGSSGQVLTSGGSGSAVTWATIPNQVTITGNASNRIITGGSGVILNATANFTYDGNQLQVYAQTDDTDCVLHLVGKTASGGAGQAGRTAIIAESTNNSNGQSSMHFRTRNTSNAQIIGMTIDGNQSVGIGTQLPASQLNLKLSSRTSGFRITDSNSTADCLRAGAQPDGDGLLQLRTTGGSGPVLFDASGVSYITGGNFGVGTVSPTRSFHVKGMASGNSTNRMMIIESTGTAGSFLAFQDANTTDDSTCRIGSIGGNSIGIRGDAHHFQNGGGTNRMIIDSSGRVIITNDGVTNSTGTNTQYAPLTVRGNTSATSSRAAFINFARSEASANISANEGRGEIWFGDQQAGEYAAIKCAADAAAAVGDYPGRLTFHTTGDGGTTMHERLRIAANGKIYVKGGGGDSTTDFSDAGTFFNLKHDTYGGRIGFSNGTASAGVTLMEQLGYWGSNKVAGWIMTAGGDASNRDDGEMSFYTRESGQGLFERLHIGTEGEVVTGYRVGTSSVRSNQPVAFHSANVTPHGNARRVSTGQRCNLFVGSNSGWSAGDGGVIAMGGSETGGAGVEATWAYVTGKRQSGNGWEYGGYFEVGTSPYSGTVMAKRMRLWANGQMEVYPNDDTFYSTSIGGAQRMVFKHNGGGAIEIKNNNGNMTFTSSSDYRLKKDEVAISNALTTVKALKPYQFTWKSDGKLGQGFFAHEAQAVLPDIGVVSGTKDEVHTNDETENGGQYKKDDPIYQGIDYSKLVPLLTAALQEETAKREALEARVAALEGS